MSWMNETDDKMKADLGDNPTEDEIEQWYGDYYRKHLYPFLPSSRIEHEDDTQ